MVSGLYTLWQNYRIKQPPDISFPQSTEVSSKVGIHEKRKSHSVLNWLKLVLIGNDRRFGMYFNYTATQGQAMILLVKFIIFLWFKSPKNLKNCLNSLVDLLHSESSRSQNLFHGDNLWRTPKTKQYLEVYSKKNRTF